MKITKLLGSYTPNFVEKLNDLKSADLTERSIELLDKTRYKNKCKTPPQEREQIKIMLEYYWAIPINIFIINRTSEKEIRKLKTRFCVNYLKLDNKTKKSNYTLLNTYEIIYWVLASEN